MARRHAWAHGTPYSFGTPQVHLAVHSPPSCNTSTLCLTPGRELELTWPHRCLALTAETVSAWAFASLLPNSSSTFGGKRFPAAWSCVNFCRFLAYVACISSNTRSIANRGSICRASLMLDLPFTRPTALLVLTPQQLVPCLNEHQLACETQFSSVRLKRKHIFFHMRARTSCEASARP